MAVVRGMLLAYDTEKRLPNGETLSNNYTLEQVERRGGTGVFR